MVAGAVVVEVVVGATVVVVVGAIVVVVEVVVVVGATVVVVDAATDMDKFSVCCSPPKSCTVTLKDELPDVTGVPVI